MTLTSYDLKTFFILIFKLKAKFLNMLLTLLKNFVFGHFLVIWSAMKHDNEVKLIRSLIIEVRDFVSSEIINIQCNLNKLGKFQKVNKI